MDQLYVAASLSILVISITICYIKSFLKKRALRLPPGPRGLPILGYLPFLRGNLLHHFKDLADNYGPIFKLNLGNKLCVVINSPSLIKEVVRSQDANFANRDAPVAALLATYGGNDIVWSRPNSQWRSMRKLFVQEMMSNKSLEESYVLRKEEVRKAIRQVHSKKGTAIEIGELSFKTQLNAIMNMLWGGTMEGEEGERIAAEAVTVLGKLIDLTGSPNISDFYPALARFDIQGVKKRMGGYVQSMDKIFDGVIAQHKKKYFSGEIKEGKKDFLHIMLELQKKQDSEISITLTQIKAILMDTVAGGSDTTATTTEWAIAELMNNPDAMNKAQTELSEVVGLNNMVEESHIPKLKYLEAVVMETMRLHPAIPLLVPRTPSESCTVGGYTIPTKTMVFINAWSVQRDPSVWNKPLEFRPDRFLDDHERREFRDNHCHYLPFGSGRRMCAGMPLGERMLMYLLASLLHSFDWKLPQGESLDMLETFGIVLRKNTPLVGIPHPRLSHSDLYM